MARLWYALCRYQDCCGGASDNIPDSKRFSSQTGSIVLGYHDMCSHTTNQTKTENTQPTPKTLEYNVRVCVRVQIQFSTSSGGASSSFAHLVNLFLAFLAESRTG